MCTFVQFIIVVILFIAAPAPATRNDTPLCYMCTKQGVIPCKTCSRKYCSQACQLKDIQAGHLACAERPTSPPAAAESDEPSTHQAAKKMVKPLPKHKKTVKSRERDGAAAIPASAVSGNGLPQPPISHAAMPTPSPLPSSAGFLSPGLPTSFGE